MADQPRVLIFRDKLLLPSEGFIPSHYVGFQNAQPVYLANQLGWRVDALDAPCMSMANGAIGRALYKQFGICAKGGEIAQHGAVAIHAHFGRGGALALPLARRLGLPLYVTYHGGDATKKTHSRARLIPSIYQRRLAALQNYASGFLCVSDFVTARLAAQGFPANKLMTHYIGIDLATMKGPTERSDDAPYLFVGRLVDKKGVDVMLAALHALDQSAGKPPPVQIAGTGPQMDALQSAASGLDNVTFLGWQTPEQLAERLATCRAMIVPSKEAPNGDCEGLPTVVLEAIRAGVPVIASDHAGIPEIIVDGETGLLVPEDNVDALAAAIARHMAMAPADVSAMVARSQAAVRQRFDAAKQSRRLETILLGGN